jgi:ribulose-phosphate 3-epimerase
MIEIYPTNTCPSDFADLYQRSDAFSAFSKYIHLDIGDERFVPVRSWPYGDGQWDEIEKKALDREVLPFTETANYEAHLMVLDPKPVGELLARMGCMRLLGHAETFTGEASIPDTFAAWKKAGAAEVGLAVLLDTPLSQIEPLVSLCDAVLLMSIAKLGKQGAPFDERIFERVSELHEKHPELVIAVDGGVGPANIAQLVHAGATRFGVGSAITKAPDPGQAYAHLMELAVSV